MDKSYTLGEDIVIHLLDFHSLYYRGIRLVTRAVKTPEVKVVLPYLCSIWEWLLQSVAVLPSVTHKESALLC